MTQILIIHDDKKLAAELNKQLIKNLGCEVMMQDSSRNAISMMALIPDIDLIICKDLIKKDQVPSKMVEFLPQHNKDLGRDVLLLILGENKTEYAKSKAIDQKSSWEKIVVEAGVMLGITVTIEVPVEAPAAPAAPVIVAPSYYPFNIKFLSLLIGQTLKFDTYLKIKNKANMTDYELIMKAEQPFDKTMAEKLMVKGITEVYITKEQIASADNMARSQLLTKVKTPPTTEKEKDIFLSDCFDLTMDLIKGNEIDDYVISLVSFNINEIMSFTADPRALDVFLKKRKTQKLSFAYSHCLLSILIIQNIIKNFKWSTQEIKDNIVYLLYFHDITLHNERLVRIHHNYFQKSAELTPEESKIVLNHALSAASILEKFKDLPSDLAPAIKEHHGVKNGNNFVESLSIIVSPFTMMLIVVEDFVAKFLELPLDDKKEKENLNAIFNEMSKKYTKLTYVEAFKATQRLIEEGGEKIAAEEAAAALAARLAKAALAASVAAVTAAETAAKSEALKAKTQAQATRAATVATKAAEEKANADKELAAAVANSLKLSAEHAAAEQAVANALAAVQKAAAAKLEADQVAILAKQAVDKNQNIISSLTSAAEKAKAAVIQTIADKAAAEQAAWKAADQATADQAAKVAAEQLAAERAAATTAGRKT
jgi:HD-GYP domain-containing protein (c-di-GMP phosphodiesterase class II)